MAEVKYLNENGLSTVWSKVKGIVTPKADKVSGATAGHLAGLNSGGNLVDSGLAADNIAQKDGSYSGMTVGAAEDLVSAESVASEFTSRITGGSTAVGKGGTALVDKIKGRTLVWNQAVMPNISIGSIMARDDSVTTEQKYVTRTTTETTTRALSWISGQTVPVNHKALIMLTMKSDYEVAPFLRYLATTGTYNSLLSTGYTAGEWKTYKAITSSGFMPDPNTGIVITGNTYVQGKYISFPLNGALSVIDLTLMFGAGNEPTITEFEALYPDPFYAYNPGTLISNAATAIETEGWNLYDPATEKARVIGGKQYHVGGTYTSLSKDGATITPDASGLFTPDTSGEVTVAGGTSTDTIISLSDPSRNDTYEPYWRSELDLNIPTLTGKLNGTGNSVVIFPDGLRSAGTVYDEIVGNKAIKRIGVVDLGTLEWGTANSGLFYSDTITDKQVGYNLICPKYPTHQGNYSWSVNDKTMGGNTSSSYSNRIYLKDTDYTAAAALEAAIAGVPLYYELATPEEYILDEAIPTAMRNDPYGTERRLPEDTASIVTAPFRADITYSTNIKEAVQSLPQNYININSMQDFLAELGTLMGGTWTMRPADGKFDFTFTPNPSNE